MLQIGTVLANRYQLLEQVGSGGVAVVFRGMDTKLHREVAVKVMREDFINDPVQVEKFRQEAHAIAMLSHPNIAGIYDIGTEQGMEYMVKEYVDGMTLKEYIRRRHRMTSDEIVKVTIKIAEALQCAHASSIIHRDIKPQNVLVTPKGEVKVTDFGIAKFVKAATVTEHKEAMGSVHYLSPEQARGMRVDERSDLYSLGITMYEMATGRPPFDGDTPVAVAMQQLNTPMPSPRDLAPDLWLGLETIILGLTRKNPAERYQSAAELIADLKRVYQDPRHGSVAERPHTPQAAAPAPARKTETKQPKSFWQKHGTAVLASVLGVLIVILTVVVIAGLVSAGHSEPGVNYVPNFKGKTLQEAQREVTENGLNIVFADSPQEAFSEVYTAGQILSQEPMAGAKVEEDTVVVTLTLSKGKREMTKVPDYLDNSYENAIQDLVDRGFRYRIEIVEVEAEKGKNNVVVDQSPKAGTEYTEDMTIVLSLALAKEELAEVPDLYNKTHEEAKALLEKAGFKLGAVTESTSSTVEEGRVIAQSVDKGQKLVLGSSVVITVSTGAYKEDSEEAGGVFLLSDAVFGTDTSSSARIKIVARVDGDNVTLVDQEYNRTVLAAAPVWVKYPQGASQLRVLVDGREVLSLSLEN